LAGGHATAQLAGAEPVPAVIAPVVAEVEAPLVEAPLVKAPLVEAPLVEAPLVSVVDWVVPPVDVADGVVSPVDGPGLSVVVMRPMRFPSGSVNHSAPSGPAAMPDGRPKTGNSVITPRKQ
jgi:ribonuclease E